MRKKKLSKKELEKLAEKHTFAICAYQESRYLEDCIKSLLKQKIPTNYLIATSTPNKHIQSLAKNIKYLTMSGRGSLISKMIGILPITNLKLSW